MKVDLLLAVLAILGIIAHIPQEDRSKCHHFSCHRFEILKSNVLIISEIFIKDILHFHDLAGYMLAHCTWHEHE